MTDLDEIARRAGTELRDWAPTGPDEAPSAAMAGRVRRRRAGRSVAGVAAVALVVVAGIGLAGGDDRPDSTVVPAGGGDPAPTTTESAPSTTTSEVDPPAPPQVPTVDAPADPGADFVNLCVIDLAGEGSMRLVVPPGWLVNDEVPATDGVPGVPFCQVFGPVPVQIADAQLPDGWGSNGAVSVVPEPVAGFGPAGSWEQYLADRSAVPPAEARVVEGRPALREELSENGEPWLRWTFLLGDTVVTATASASVEAGVSYDEAAAALDEMVATVRHVD